VRQEGTSRHHVMTLDVPLLNRTVQSTAEDVPNPSQSVTYAGFAGNDVKRQLSLTHHRKPKRDMRLRHSPAGRSPQTTTQRVSVVRWSSTSAACSHVRFSSHLSTVLVAATLCNVHQVLYLGPAHFHVTGVARPHRDNVHIASHHYDRTYWRMIPIESQVRR